jgi:hypothetical protein
MRARRVRTVLVSLGLVAAAALTAVVANGPVLNAQPRKSVANDIVWDAQRVGTASPADIVWDGGNA